jgi:tetratricopeptide (TPR) repeat protein
VGARSFYYPAKAEQNCNGCHMPLRPSDDFGAKLFAGATQLSVHDHLFPGANTGLAWLIDSPKALAAHREILEGCLRVDIFGVKEGGVIDGRLHAPLRPELPKLRPGGKYLLESVIRTLTLGHHFTQGTADSNEVWMEVKVTSGDRLLAHSGAITDDGEVDRWAHFINVFMLDKEGNRINRRNAQDIFVPLYNHQIPPGAGQVVHYAFNVPDDVTAPIRVEMRVNFRKFDKEYAEIFTSQARAGDRPIRGHVPGEPYGNPLPVVVLAEDVVTFPVEGVEAMVESTPPDIPLWQRWNDYGIGLFREGKAELRQAAHAFEQVHRLGRYDGKLNLARVLHREGRIDEAVEAVRAAAEFTDPAPPPWTLGWLSGLLNREQGYLEAAEENLRSVLSEPTAEMRERGFDFRRDYEVINLLGQVLFDRANQLPGSRHREARETLLREAVEQFERTLAIDSENVTAHHNLALLHARLGDVEKAEYHRQLHTRYKPDDNARDRAVALARRKYPAANHAAEALVIYPLRPPTEQGAVETATEEPTP